MSETNDNLFGAASEETTAEGQAEGTTPVTTSESETSTAAPATTDSLIDGKFKTPDDLLKAYKELEKKLGSRGAAKESMQDLGLAAEVKPPETKAEAKQMAQEVGGDGAVAWLEQRAKEVGWAKANAEFVAVVAREAAKNAVAQTLTPVNQTLEGLQYNRNEEMKEAAIEQLSSLYSDFEDRAKDIGVYLKANPDIRQLIETAPSKAAKAKYLRLAYLEVKELKGTVSTAAAKTAGAVEAKRQDAMKASSVTAGSGTGKRGDAPKDIGDEWLESMQSMEKHRGLFDN